MAKNRTAIPLETAVRVMFEHDRSCCVCGSRVHLQIHHIDEDPSNHEPDNLAVLCLEHHNDTQVRGGFARELGPADVRYHRDDWIRRVARRKEEADKIAAAREGGTKNLSDEARSDPPSSFLLRALRDADGANLDRIQIVKGWLGKDGKTEEKVYDVAWSGERQPGADGKLPPVGNTVNVEEATYSNAIGAPILEAFWKDPDFDPAERAFYYVRVLEIPTPRWTTYDAKIFGVPRMFRPRSRSGPTPRPFGTRRKHKPLALWPDVRCWRLADIVTYAEHVRS